MAKREEKRRALREALVDAAWNRIASEGLAGLNARDLTRDAGCALGGIYTAFRDLDDLVMHANARTLALLGDTLETAVAGRRGGAALHALAEAYMGFALTRRRLWNALFEHPPPPDDTAPDWFVAGHVELLRFVVQALRELPLDEPEDALEARARSYFAAVHGIVSISIHSKFVGLSQDRLAAELTSFVRVLTAGIAAEAAGRTADPQASRA